MPGKVEQDRHSNETYSEQFTFWNDKSPIISAVMPIILQIDYHSMGDSITNQACAV